jgi:hypothetical protein
MSTEGETPIQSQFFIVTFVEILHLVILNLRNQFVFIRQEG